jgi:hypothetical protein
MDAYQSLDPANIFPESLGHCVCYQEAPECRNKNNISLILLQNWDECTVVVLSPYGGFGNGTSLA